MTYKIVKGNLLEATTEYIVQQNNCTCLKPQGLSEAISTKWPGVNPYSARKAHKGNWSVLEDRTTPGTVELYEFEQPLITGLKGVICAFAQYTHGKPGTLKDSLGIIKSDTSKDRAHYIGECLESIATLEPKSVGFPYKIGCGLAGGSWSVYERMLKQWAEAYPTIDVIVYQME